MAAVVLHQPIPTRKVDSSFPRNALQTEMRSGRIDEMHDEGGRLPGRSAVTRTEKRGEHLRANAVSDHWFSGYHASPVDKTASSLRTQC